MSTALRRPLGRAVEWEYQRITLDRDLSRSAVTQLLVEQAEHGGWVLHRSRIAPDGVRSVVLRRKIIRQLRRPTLLL